MRSLQVSVHERDIPEFDVDGWLTEVCGCLCTAQLRKCLTRISTLEQVKIPPTSLERLVAASNGDIRHALNTLQLIHNGEERKPTNRGLSVTKATKKVKENRNGVDATELAAIGRDAFLSEFHVLGKILHGKTLAKETDEKKTASSPIDYEEMIDASGMSVDKVLAFVHENSLSYYSAIEDVADAMELMSLTENFVAKSYSGVGNSEVRFSPHPCHADHSVTNLCLRSRSIDI